MENSRFIVVANGEFKNDSLKILDLDFVCACDGGYKYLNERNIEPDLVVGDFDSLDLVPKAKEVVQLNPIKDDTDLLHAINIGLDRGFKDFVIYGGTGKREEHTFANYQILYYLKRKNANVIMINNNKSYFVLSNETKCLNYKKGYISLFSLAPKSILTLKGLKYEIEKKSVTNFIPLCIDNEFINKPSMIQVISGVMLVIIDLNL